MRVLHVWDQAGVSGILAKYQRSLGHVAEVVVRDGYDPAGQKKFYREHIIGPKKYLFS
jgi:hypothetical protein